MAARALRSQYGSSTLREASGVAKPPVKAIKNFEYRTPEEIAAEEEAAMAGEGGSDAPTRAERLARQQAAKDAEQARLDAMASEGPISMNRVKSGLPAIQGGRDLAPVPTPGMPATIEPGGLPAVMGDTGLPATMADKARALELAKQKIGGAGPAAPDAAAGNPLANVGSTEVNTPPVTVGGESAQDMLGANHYTPGGVNLPTKGPSSYTPESAAVIAAALALASKYGAMGNPTGVSVVPQAPSTGMESRFPGMADIAARLGTAGQEKRFPSADDRAALEALAVGQIARGDTPLPPRRPDDLASDVPMPPHRPADLMPAHGRPDFQSNGQRVLNGNKINWGDSDSSADFFRASQALQDNPDMSGMATGGAVHPHEVVNALRIIHRALGGRG